MKRRLSVLLALAMMFGATAAVAGPASGDPQGNNGHHYAVGDVPHEDFGKHNGAGAGAGKYSNESEYAPRRGLR